MGRPTLDELTGMSALDINPNYDEREFRALLQPLIARQVASRTVVTTHRHDNGSTVDVECVFQSPEVFHDGERRSVVAFARDITDRLETERILQRIVDGEGRMEDLELIESLAGRMVGRVLCADRRFLNLRGPRRLLGYHDARGHPGSAWNRDLHDRVSRGNLHRLYFSPSVRICLNSRENGMSLDTAVTVDSSYQPKVPIVPLWKPAVSLG